MRLVLDTCVLFSAVRSKSGASRLLLRSALAGDFGIVVSYAVLSEYADVLFRAENRVADWTDERLHSVLDTLALIAEWAQPHFRYRPTLSDAGDELMLEAAINGQAHIATFNVKHFGPASRFGIQVYQPRDILEILNERGIAHGTD